LYTIGQSLMALLTKRSMAAAAELCSAGHLKSDWTRVCDGR
jgi:hypothetical protein